MGFLLRILFLIALIFLILNLVKKARLQPANKNKNQKDDTIQMVKCTECQIQFPQSEAVSTGPYLFCCTEHMQRWLAQK